MTLFRLFGNGFWLIFGGLLEALLWFLAGCICCITLIGIPVGRQCFKFAHFMLCPFGKTIDYGRTGSGSMVLNVIWILLCGIELAAAAAAMGVLCCITLIGIPFGLQHFKFALLALAPFGAQIRNS